MVELGFIELLKRIAETIALISDFVAALRLFIQEDIPEEVPEDSEWEKQFYLDRMSLAQVEKAVPARGQRLINERFHTAATGE